MTLSEFFFETPLYTRLKIGEQIEVSLVHEILNNSPSEPFTGFDPISKWETSYSVVTTTYHREIEENTYSAPIICLRSKRRSEFFVRFSKVGKDSYIEKIGQYPSIADFHIGRIKQFDKVLEGDFSKEYARAIGLAAHGVGIGSFVYLRRIFESLVIEASVKAIGDGAITKEDFDKLRMAEKIAALKAYLPELVFEHKESYSILSKGIHSLSDDVCLSYFEVLRISIELILEQKLEERKRAEKAAAIKAALSQAASKLK